MHITPKMLWLKSRYPPLSKKDMCDETDTAPRECCHEETSTSKSFAKDTFPLDTMNKDNHSPPPKRVRFSPEARARKVSSWRNFSEAEIEATWYSDDERKLIRQSCTRDVQMLDKGKNVRCKRGLERHMRSGRSTRHQNVSKSIAAVLDEQDAQWKDEDKSKKFEGDAEAIAVVYRKVTSRCRIYARNVGMADCNDIKEYLHSSEEETETIEKNTCHTFGLKQRAGAIRNSITMPQQRRRIHKRQD